MPADAPHFDGNFQDTLGELFAWRRDVRRFKTYPIAEEVLQSILKDTNLAPSVGNSQPWRWVRVDDPRRRSGVQENFERCNLAAADGYDQQTRLQYLSLKLEGLRDAPVQFGVFCDCAVEEGKGLGRQTMPEMLLYSTVISIHTFWLAARARGIGVGWVSILEPDGIESLLDTPATWKFVAYLCVGWPQEEHVDPELDRAGWQNRRPLQVIRR